MIELENFENQHSSPDNFQVKRLSKITFIGLFNSFNSVHNKLAKLKEQGSIDILKVKKDLIEAKEHIFQIYLSIDSILPRKPRKPQIQRGRTTFGDRTRTRKNQKTNAY